MASVLGTIKLVVDEPTVEEEMPMMMLEPLTGDVVAGFGNLLESPRFTSDTTLADDYSSVYGWDTNEGWAVTASASLGAARAARAFNKTNTGDGDGWHSITAPVKWLKIQFPHAVVLDSYTITSRNDNRYVWFPTKWHVRGSLDGTTWTDLEEPRIETTWAHNTSKTFDAGITRSVAYRQFMLYIESSRRTDTIADSAHVVIGEWILKVLTPLPVEPVLTGIPPTASGIEVYEQFSVLSDNVLENPKFTSASTVDFSEYPGWPMSNFTDPGVESAMMAIGRVVETEIPSGGFDAAFNKSTDIITCR